MWSGNRPAACLRVQPPRRRFSAPVSDPVIPPAGGGPQCGSAWRRSAAKRCWSAASILPRKRPERTRTGRKKSARPVRWAEGSARADWRDRQITAGWRATAAPASRLRAQRTARAGQHRNPGKGRVRSGVIGSQRRGGRRGYRELQRSGEVFLVGRPGRSCGRCRRRSPCPTARACPRRSVTPVSRA